MKVKQHLLSSVCGSCFSVFINVKYLKVVDSVVSLLVPTWMRNKLRKWINSDTWR